jgi:hypothetical protein
MHTNRVMQRKARYLVTSLVLAGCSAEPGSQPAPKAEIQASTLVTTASAALEPNPDHLELEVLNPFDASANVTSTAPCHHRMFGNDVIQQVGDLALDVSHSAGTGGKPVYFRMNALSPATAVQGKVSSGGKGKLHFACSSKNPADGGYVVYVNVEAKYGDVWTPIGRVTYAHVEDVQFADGETVSNNARIATATSQFGGECSKAPHVHIELYNLKHFPCHVHANLSGANATIPLAASASVGRVGGSRSTGVSKCSGRINGDVNGDGKVDITDALTVAQVSAGYPKPDTYDLEAGEVTCGCTEIVKSNACNCAPNIADAQVIANYAAGLRTSFQCKQQ